MKSALLLAMVIPCFVLMSGACNHSVPGPDKDDNQNDTSQTSDIAKQDLMRAMEITDSAFAGYFSGNHMTLASYYNPFTATRSSQVGSIWEYTSAIEAVNGILLSLKAFKAKGQTELYDKYFDHYAALLSTLFDDASYYKGTFTLTSYTQTKAWSPYAVNRAQSKGTADVQGKNNVYDDQEWLIRQLFRSYKATGDETYFKEAEYLTNYVLDGWDCTLDQNGHENGGITWGPGYVTKHSCSNGPLISSLVWLYQYYKDKDASITYKFITTDGERQTASKNKAAYYLDFAKKIYTWQKGALLRPDGVYDDMRGGCGSCAVMYETVDGVTYRKHVDLPDRVGPAYTYNSGAMLSGAVDLFGVTGDNTYLDDAKTLADASFEQFAQLGATKPGYYTYPISGHSNWFNDVLLRGFVDIYPLYETAFKYVSSFQDNLDYGYDNYEHGGFLPANLLVGWSPDRGNNQVAALFTFAFASEYAMLSQVQLEKNN